MTPIDADLGGGYDQLRAEPAMHSELVAAVEVGAGATDQSTQGEVDRGQSYEGSSDSPGSGRAVASTAGDGS